MLWFTVWTVLVVTTLVGAFFLVRHVYRSGKALLAELEAATALTARFAEQAEILSAAAAELHPLHPVDLTNPEPARRRRDESALATSRRRAARLDRREATFRRWRALSH